MKVLLTSMYTNQYICLFPISQKPEKMPCCFGCSMAFFFYFCMDTNHHRNLYLNRDMNWETLLCLGDSITIGARSYLSYPEYCGHHLSKETNKKWNVVNHAVSGYKTVDLLRDIDKHFSTLKVIKPDIATILIGTNDLKSNLAAETFRKAYELLVLKVRLVVGNQNIMLLEIPKLKSGVMFPYRIEMNQTVEVYNQIIHEIATTSGYIYSKIDCDDHHFFDGVHLNEQGSEAFGQHLAESILTLRRG